jgi:hypothetical protein
MATNANIARKKTWPLGSGVTSFKLSIRVVAGQSINESEAAPVRVKT